jgi:signal peptidase I
MSRHEKHEKHSENNESSKRQNKSSITWKKIWRFLWNDDSIWSWVINIILAFILIKFVVYPLLGLLFATGFPIVAVVSGSMEHAYAPATDSSGYNIERNGQVLYSFCNDSQWKENSFLNLKDYRNFDTFWSICGKWYTDRNITHDEFKTFPFTNGFNKGDIMVLYGAKLKDIKVGDIIVFKSTLRSDPIIHRVVKITVDSSGNYHFTTKGDHNSESLSAELDTTQNNYIAKAVVDVPYLGWIKIWFTYIFTGFKPIH